MATPRPPVLSRANFSITQLEYVMAVYKHGHFAQAAKACYVTQPTLSMQIQKLETELGVVLFDRSKKPILLTEAGEKIIEQVQLILFEVRKIEGLLQAEEGVRGTLEVGIIPTVAPYLLPRFLSHLEKKYPHMFLNIKEMQTEKIVEALENDELDVGLLAIPLNISKIFERSLFYEPFWVLCDKNHPYAQLKKIKDSKLKNQDVWLLEEGHCLRSQALDICSITPKSSRKFQFESGSLETLKNLIERYGGYTLIPQLATERFGKQSRLVPFDSPIPSREIGLVYRREHYKSEMIEALAESILKSLPLDFKKTKFKNLNVVPVR